MKHIIWMAALALTAATWSACSNEDELTTTEQPAQQARTFTVTTTLSPRNGGTRSTMTDNGDGSISATWQVNDEIWVFYQISATSFVETTARVTAIDPTTKAATITMTLNNPKDGGDITFGYPYSYYAGTKDPDTDQIGTLADINANFAAISGSGNMTVSGTDVTLPAVTMAPEMCIWKFSFTDGENDITSAITKLVIGFPANNQTYAVTPSEQANIYVALSGDGLFTNVPISITAKTATGVYHKTAESVTLTAGKMYTSTGIALTSAAAANAVLDDHGKVIGADGNIYPYADVATAIGTTALALITYVGNDAETSAGNTDYKHGLALALSDANNGNKCAWCSQLSTTCLGTQYDYTGAKGDMAGIAHTDYLINNAGTHTHAAASAARNYNSGTHPAGTSAWFLPSAGQWQKMIGAAGTYSDLRGNANLQPSVYWTSTECATNCVWVYLFGSGYGEEVFKHRVGSDSEEGEHYVRSALAF